jgi:hypothetical protein
MQTVKHRSCEDKVFAKALYENPTTPPLESTFAM